MFGKLGIVIAQCPDRISDLLFGESAHCGDLEGDLLQIALEGPNPVVIARCGVFGHDDPPGVFCLVIRTRPIIYSWPGVNARPGLRAALSLGAPERKGAWVKVSSSKFQFLQFEVQKFQV
jgi:hypothetical protein